MNEVLFRKELLSQLEAAPRLVVGPDDPGVVVISDLHMGNGGSRDDLEKNGALVKEVLEDWYFPRGHTLVLNGDIEELQRFTLPEIRGHWADLYRIFDRYAAAGRLRKIVGNHDLALLDEPDYPYPLLQALRLDVGSRPYYIYHGHQASAVFVKYNHLVRSFLRYVANPLGIKNYSVSKDRRRRFVVEKRIYRFSRSEGLVSVIGHTHRPLFESLSKYDFLKFEIENLCREYADAGQERRDAIGPRVWSLKKEFAKMAKKDKKRSLRSSLYGDELLVPCLFNSGCAIGKKGVTLLEFTPRDVSLVYWYPQGKAKKYVRVGGYEETAMDGRPWRRVALNEDRLDFVDARINLLGQ